MRLFGIIGRPLGHSQSAAHFSKKFADEGIDARYERFELATIEDITTLPAEIEGFNVTIPYKKAIIPYLDALSPEAQAIGAVNCVVCRNGKRTGHNTDVIGIRSTLNKLIGSEQVSSALILGTGGASAAVQYALAERNIEFAIVSRDAARGNLTYDQLSPEIMAETRLIINTTPVGMYPNVDDAPAIPYEALDGRHLMFDLVYNPPVTAFLQRGKDAGARTIDGVTMFLEQAKASWEIWNESFVDNLR